MRRRARLAGITVTRCLSPSPLWLMRFSRPLSSNGPPQSAGPQSAGALHSEDVQARQKELVATYTAWAARRDLGDAAEFIRGATEAYAALGQHIQELVEGEGSEPPPPPPFLSDTLIDDLKGARSGNPYQLAHPRDMVEDASISIITHLEESLTVKDQPGMHLGVATAGNADDDDREDAMVMAVMHVVVPPERFLPHYTFYRERFHGASEELKRSAAVWLAATPLYPLAWMGDVLHRMVKKSPWCVTVDEEYCRSVLRMPEGALRPPLYRKNVLFRFDPSGRWIMESVDNVGFVSGVADVTVL